MAALGFRLLQILLWGRTSAHWGSQQHIHMLLSSTGIHSRLSSSLTAWGSCASLVTVVPQRHKASKFVLSTKDPSIVKMKEHLVGEVNTLLFTLVWKSPFNHSCSQIKKLLHLWELMSFKAKSNCDYSMKYWRNCWRTVTILGIRRNFFRGDFFPRRQRPPESPKNNKVPQHPF